MGPLFRPHFGTRSAADVVRFYCPLFGWSFRTNGERDASVSFLRGPDEVATSVPPVDGFEWSEGGCYPAFWVDSVAVYTARAASLGARSVRRRDVGRAASSVVTSPTGEIFGLIEEDGESQASHADAALEIVTPDPVTTRRFYEALFGFTARTRAGRHALHTSDGSRVAGISELHADWEDGAFLRATGRIGPATRGFIPPHWMVYFRVPDLDEALSRAVFLGGSLVVRHELEPELLPVALVRDPFGHFSSLIGPS